jgi:hypothetical protein
VAPQNLLEAAALEAFGAVAIEVIGTEFAISGRLCHQVVSDLENMTADREHCPSMSVNRISSPAPGCTILCAGQLGTPEQATAAVRSGRTISRSFHVSMNFPIKFDLNSGYQPFRKHSARRWAAWALLSPLIIVTTLV